MFTVPYNILYTPFYALWILLYTIYCTQTTTLLIELTSTLRKLADLLIYIILNTGPYMALYIVCYSLHCTVHCTLHDTLHKHKSGGLIWPYSWETLSFQPLVHFCWILYCSMYYTLYCTLYSIRYLHCTIYSTVHCTMHCIVYCTVHCTIYYYFSFRTKAYSLRKTTCHASCLLSGTLLLDRILYNVLYTIL